MSNGRERAGIEISFPDILLSDPGKKPHVEQRAIFVDSDQSLIAGGNLSHSFRLVDGAYEANPLGYFRMLEGSVDTLKTEHGSIDTSLLFGSDITSEDIALVFSPLNDGKPMSNAEDIFEYTRGSHTRGDKRKAQPNSWGPLTKLSITHELGSAEGIGMPHLQLFAREVPALSSQEKKAIAQGITLPYGRLAVDALRVADNLRNQLTGTGGFKRVHLFGAGMGSKALGAGVELLNSDYEVASVTAQNLAIGTATGTRLLGDYMTKRMLDSPSFDVVPSQFERIIEPLIRREVDGFGAESAMRRRNIRALLNWRIVRGVMGTEQPARYIEELLGANVSVTVANPRNEAMNAKTELYLPLGQAGMHYTEIVGVNGKEVGQAENEHAAVVALVSGIGIRNWMHDKEAA